MKDIKCKCGKLLARLHDDGKIYVWCKGCKKEIALVVLRDDIIYMKPVQGMQKKEVKLEVEPHEPRTTSKK